VEHFDRPGGHIGLMAGSKARQQIWPDVARWLAARSALAEAPSDAAATAEARWERRVGGGQVGGQGMSAAGPG
jgi:hypothetical protein